MPEFNPTNFPYIKGKDTDTDDGTAIGGRCMEIPSASALKLGEAVIVSAAMSVDKSNTAADATKRVGIVVGGDLTGMRAISDKSQYGVLTVTSAGGTALVQIDGLVYTIADAAIASAGNQLTLGTTTAGRVDVAADLTTDGVTVSGTRPGAIFGTNLETAAAAGDVMLTLLALS